MTFSYRSLVSDFFALALPAVLAAACADAESTFGEREPYAFTQVVDAPSAALLSVHGTSANNVYAVGADDGQGPLALHWDGDSWTELDPGVEGDLWWVHVTDSTVWMAGANSHVLRLRDGQFERMTTPGLGKHIIFGLWSAGVGDVYAVGSVAGRNGFIWHFDGTTWTQLDLPAEIAQDAAGDIPQLFKVWGSDASDVWVIGAGGVVMNGNAADGFALVDSPTDDLLFTVHATADDVVVVGGTQNGVAWELGGRVRDVSPSNTSLLQGVWIQEDGTRWMSGAQGTVIQERGGILQRENRGDTRDVQSLHAIWVDDEGGVWTVGGNVLTADLDEGVLLYGDIATSDDPTPTLLEVDDPTVNPVIDCPAAAIDPAPQGSIARRWNEQLLNAVRRDIPRPTVHARNLFHVSAAQWDIYAAYNDTAQGYLVEESRAAADVDATLDEAMSYAAYTLLTHRYGTAAGGPVSVSCFDAFMAELGYDPTDAPEGSAAAFGQQVAQAYIDAFADDGANEANDYADPEDYVPTTPRLVVDEPGSNAEDPTQWQQLVLAEAVTQNGIPEGSGVRGYVGAHWGNVTTFALERPGLDAPYYDLSAPLELNDDLVDATVEVLRRAAELELHNDELIDVSPASYGNNPLGTDDGEGYERNPFTGSPYAPNLVRRGDFTRLMSEFWADGPTSETPPGHWFSIANEVEDSIGFSRRLYGEGEALDPLAWDVHLYVALAGAVHDAAVAAWEQKRVHLSARPITLIRWMGEHGQRTDENDPSYAADGLPLVDGLIEVITAESSARGERHAHLSRYVGDIAVYSWRGEPGDRDHELGGLGWIRASTWVPYQRRTFVTPAFPGFVSGHSTFSRAAAEVLATFTGSPYVPGGIGGYTLEPGWLFFEFGPSEPVEVQWATYFDAADQAGQSRLWGGIHVRQDDYEGRIIGADVGQRAIARASELFGAP
jgi:hypothetical protein